MQVAVPLSLLEEPLCLLLGCLGVGNCSWLSVHRGGSASETPSRPQRERARHAGRGSQGYSCVFGLF